MPMRPLPLVATLALSLGAASCHGESPTFARATEIASLDEAIGGPKALARPGDLLIENDRIRVAVLGKRNSMGPGLYGGSVIDVDLQRDDPRYARGNGRDAFAELIPTVNLNVPYIDAEDPEPTSIEILADGSDGGAAIIRVSTPAEPFITMLGALWAIVGAPDAWMVTDYILEPGATWLTLRTDVLYGYDPADPLPADVPDAGYSDDTMPVLTWAVENGVAIGDFYLQGGMVDVFGPGIGFDEDGAVFESRQRGENTLTEPFRFPFLAGTSDGVSYGIAPKEGVGFVPLFTASQTAVIGGGREGDGTRQRFPPGTALRYERYLFVGHGDVGSIVDGWVEARGVAHGTVHGQVVEEGTAGPVSGAQVFVYEPGAEKPWSQWETDVHPNDERADGSFGGRVPVGDWELLVHVEGRPDSPRVPIRVEEGGEVTVNLASPRPGLVSFTVRGDDGRPMPAKVTIYRTDRAPLRDPVLGDSFIGGSPEGVLFPMYGQGEVELADGTYQAVASRGLEYELSTSEPFVVDRSRRHHLEFVLERSVLTDGWVSADLHVHASPSHDSGVALADRARTMACEGVEFFASTDHDYISDYAPVIEQLGLEEWVQTAVGVETTTVEIGHFLAFPMQQHFLEVAGGAIDWTASTPEELLEALRGQGRDAGYEPAVFVGHPRAGILGYFDQYGFDPYGGTPGLPGGRGQPSVKPSILSATNPLLKAENLSWEFDALEILNGKRFDILRTPTQPELDGFVSGEGGVRAYDFVTRTLDEQEDLKNGVYKLGYGVRGGIDDWFTLLNLGFRYTILGNSDTHGWTSDEAGCPRNYVMSETDDPAYIDDQGIADAVREHRVIASYGPFVQMWIDGQPIGSEVVPASGAVNLAIDVQAPTWMAVDRVELYENGTLVREWSVPDEGLVGRFHEELTVTPARDAWYVVVVAGDGDLGPVFSPVEIPYIELQEIVSEALGGVEAVSALLAPAIPVPRVHPVYPFAVTNPIWVDLAGDGFQAPGVPDWLEAPVAPAEE